MLKNIKNRFSRRKNSKKSILKISPGEAIRDAIIKVGMETAEKSGYTAGNATDNFVTLASSVGSGVDFGTQLVAGTESAGSLGRIAFKTLKDIARGDVVCTGLCAVSASCEAIALGCSTIKCIPYRGRVYIGVKVVSKACMSYRNLCAGEGC